MFPATADSCGAGELPFYFRRGAGRRGSNIKISEFLVKKMTIINDIRIKDHYVHNLPENRELLAYARENRRTGNMAEIAFWKQVHKKMFHGLDFDRQKVIGNYIVDFFVKRLGLVIEIDGGSHNEKADYDAQRDKYLEGLGLKVFHTTDYDVLQHVNIMLSDLRNFIVDNYEHEDYEKKE